MSQMIKCVYCGKMFDPDAEKTYQDGQVTVYRGDQKDKARQALPPKKQNAPRIVDIRCPACGREMEYNLTTHEVVNG
jgi:hypothetical protein